MKMPYWQCTRLPDFRRIPKPLVLTLPLKSCSPATSHGLQPALPVHACAGKMLNGSVQAKCSARLWVMPGPPPERQSTGDLGCVALEVDGARDQWASRVRFCPEIGLF